jgi:hypothetical protein
VVIHHTTAGMTSPFVALATYAVETQDIGDGGAGDLFMGSEDDFDVDGNPVTLPWY